MAVIIQDRLRLGVRLIEGARPEPALHAYLESFTPSEMFPEPHVILGVSSSGTGGSSELLAGLAKPVVRGPLTQPNGGLQGSITIRTTAPTPSSRSCNLVESAGPEPDYRPRTTESLSSYSALNVTSGSTLVARRAGMYPARSVTARTTPASSTNTDGSPGVT